MALTWDEDFKCYVHGAFIADPTGGATQDANARTAINSIIDVLDKARLMAHDATNTETAVSMGATVYDATAKCYVHNADITITAGGTTDAELRTAVNQILVAMRNGHLLVGGALTGPTVWDEDKGHYVFSAYTTPTGGGTEDAEGRTAANAVAAILKSAGYLSND